jgi:hypothetical protein
MFPGTCRANVRRVSHRSFRASARRHFRCRSACIGPICFPRSALRNYGVFKITIREFMPSLGILVLLLVDPRYHFAYSLNPCAARNSFSVCADGRCSLHASLSSNTKRPATMSSLAKWNADFTAMMLSHMRGRNGRVRCSTFCESIDLFLFVRPAFSTITRTLTGSIFTKQTRHSKAHGALIPINSRGQQCFGLP